MIRVPLPGKVRHLEQVHLDNCREQLSRALTSWPDRHSSPLDPTPTVLHHSS
jgi:hypothetical protein